MGPPLKIQIEQKTKEVQKLRNELEEEMDREMRPLLETMESQLETRNKKN